MKRFLFLCAALCCAAITHAQKWEGLAKTPPMGWSSWNKFGRNVDERMIRETADAMVASGLADAGYVYINIDDCWHAPDRDADGFPQCDPEHFPGGMKALADYLHIPMAQTVGIGDSDNDRAMLHDAGLSVAMGNAQADIKAQCDLITEDNDHNGVGEAICRILEL